MVVYQTLQVQQHTALNALTITETYVIHRIPFIRYLQPIAVDFMFSIWFHCTVAVVLFIHDIALFKYHDIQMNSNDFSFLI
jgi:hypothetical protein